MKKTKLFLLAMLFCGGLSAQTPQRIPNGNFESWTTVQNEWHLTHFRSSSEEDGGVMKYQPAHSGNYAVKITSSEKDLAGILGTWFPDPSKGKGGFPYSQKPTKLKVWAKYDIKANDTASVVVMFKKNGNLLTEFLQNRFKITGSHTSDYKQLEFNIQGLTETPDTIIYFVISSTFLGTPQNGSYIIVDDMSFDTSDPIPHGDFEEWGKPTEIPESWNFWGGYELTLDCNIPNPIQKTTDKHSGQYAMVGTTWWSYYEGSDGAVVGDLTSGDYVKNEAKKFPCTVQKGKFVGWYKYLPINSTDNGHISITFYKNGNHLGGPMQAFTAKQETYTYFELPFDLAETPDSAEVHGNASLNKLTINLGSKLFLDDLNIVTDTDIPQAEYDALVALYDATNGAGWNNKTNWKTDAPVKDWYGVTVENGHVTKVELSQNNLVGSIPSEIGNLTELTQLMLWANKLTGIIPTSIGSLTKLEGFAASGNQLTGTIPIEIGNLTKLTHLDLRYNTLTGIIPTSIGNLTALNNLWLANNQLNGAIPAEIGSLTALIELKLSGNKLTGNIPSAIGNLTALTRLELWSNQLTGAIPASIGNLTSLTHMDLEPNQLTGTLPAEMANLTNLVNLWLGGNNLNIGNIPTFIGNLTKLEVLSLDNSQLTGPIPAEICQLTKLQKLYLYNNQLSGSIPNEIGNLVLLKELLLNNNQLTGAVPSNITQLANMEKLYLHYNQLTSTPDLSSLTKLFHCYLAYNYLDFADISAAKVTVVGGGAYIYAQQLPIKATRTEDATNITLVMTDTPIANNIYQWYKNDVAMAGQTTNTLIINKSETGAYYCTVTNQAFPNLTLRSIAEDIGGVLTNGILTEEYNALLKVYEATGGDGWTNKTNWKSSEPVSTWNGITVVGMHVTRIILTANNLIGTIPTEIANLPELVNINVGGNQITSIPTSIGNLTKLASLSLYTNKLETIPTEVGNLNALTTLHLYSNKLTSLVDLSGLTKLTSCTVYDNALDFADLTAAKVPIVNGYNYAPQAEVKLQRISSNSNVTLSVPGTSTGNTYQWVKDNATIAETNATIVIPIANTGDYRCVVKNSNFPNLTLQTNTENISSYSLTYTAGEGGTISGNATQYVLPNGNGTEVEAVPNTGYRFLKWSDDVTTAKRTDSNVTNNISTTALFTKTQIVTYSCSSNGTLTATVASGATVDKGTSVVFTAKPNTNYTVKWSLKVGNAATTTVTGVTIADGETYTTTANDDLTVTVEFASTNGVEPNTLSDIEIYPNPFTDEIKVTNAEKITNYKIVNTLGELVLNNSHNGNATLTVKGALLKPGIYIMVMNTQEGKQITSRIIKK